MPASIAAHASSSMRGRSSEATFFCPLHPCVCSFAPARRFGASDSSEQGGCSFVTPAQASGTPSAGLRCMPSGTPSRWSAHQSCTAGSPLSSVISAS